MLDECAKWLIHRTARLTCLAMLATLLLRWWLP